MTHTAANVINDGYRGYQDDVAGAITAQTAIAAADTNFTQDADAKFHMALIATETAGGDANNELFRLEYNLAGGGWLDVTTSTPIQAVAPTNCTTTNGSSYGTTSLVTGATIQATEYDTDGADAASVSLNNSTFEYTTCLQIDSAQVSDGQTFQLRLTNAGTALDADTTICTITINVAAGPTPQSITSAGTGTASISKKIAKGISANGSGSASLVKAFSKSIGATALGSAVVSSSTLVTQAISAAASGSASLVRGFGKTISATATGNVGGEGGQPVTNFDGTNDYLSYSGNLSGVTDSQQLTIFWAGKAPPLGTVSYLVNLGSPNNYIQIQATGRIKTVWYDDAAGVVINQSPATVFDDEWINVVVSIDTTGTSYLYVNDTQYSLGTAASENIDLTPTTGWGVCGGFTGASRLDGDFSRAWMKAGTAVDITVEANRREFHEAGGGPIAPPTDSDVAFGSGSFDLAGNAATLNGAANDRSGNGNHFTMNGAVTDVSGGGGGQIIKKIFKILSAAATGSVTIAKAISKTLSAAATGAATVIADAGSITTQAINAAATGTAAISKKVSKGISATATGSASLIKSVGKILSAAATGTATMTETVINEFLQTISAAATGSATIVKKVSKGISASGSGTASLIKSFAKSISAAAVGSASIARLAVIKQAIGASATGTATFVKSISKMITAAAIGAATVTRKIFKNISTTATGSTSINKAVSKVISAISTGTATITKLAVIKQAISAIAAGTVTITTMILGPVVSGGKFVYNLTRKIAQSITKNLTEK
jgi:hypothetical protein